MSKKIFFRWLQAVLMLLLLIIPSLLVSCEEDLEPYNESDGLGRVYFIYGSTGDVSSATALADSLVNYSFIYHNNVPTDTIWLRVGTSGFLSDRDRYFELEQVRTGKNDAVAGTHYKSFDDTSFKQLLKVPGDSLQCDIPIIVFNDASLKNGNVTLKVRLKATSDFLLGYVDCLSKTITISDLLSKPANWNRLCDWYFGNYGTVKHQLMIDVSGEKWDDDYLLNVARVTDYSSQDFLRYQANKFAKALAELNAERAAQGLDPLTEDDGSLVQFPF